MAGSEWPWYEVVSDGSVDQGDLLPDCHVLTEIAAAPGQAPTAKMRQITALVVTQTCDLEQDKTETVTVCAVWSIAAAVLQEPRLRAKAEEGAKRRRVSLPALDDQDVHLRMEDLVAGIGDLKSHFNSIMKGERPAYAALPAHASPAFPKSIVSFEHVYSLPKARISAVAAGRCPGLRLRPPYREYVSAAFGRYFARIGLPKDLERY